MLKDLPTLVDPLRLAQEKCTLRGQIAIEQFARVLDSLCGTQGEVAFEWRFTTINEQPIIEGWVNAPLQMVCQRCLQPMTYYLGTSVSLAILTEGQNDDNLPAGYEALIVSETPVSLLALVEDEIILALPVAVMHDECPTNNYCLPVDSDKGVIKQHNPFQVLKRLKN